MEKAFFIVRDGMIAGSLGTAHGPFPTEEAAIDIAKMLQPGNYRVYGGATPGKTFTISAPTITFG